MESSTMATDISGLVSDLEGLVVASKNRRQRPESSLPSLQQLYRLGLLLFQILRQNNNRKSVDNDPVVTAYRELIESIPDESLRRCFADLFRAVKMLLSSATSSNSNSNNNARNLSQAVSSIEGLIGAFSDHDSQSCRRIESNSRLCRLVYDSSRISTLSTLYDWFIVFEKQQQNQQRRQDDGLTRKEIESTKKAILSCLSRLILDGLVLAGGNNSTSSSGGEASTIEESLLEAIRCMEVESTDCLRDLQELQTREEPYRRNLEESLVAIGNSSSITSADEDETMERTQQREYIVSMLESARGEPSSMAVPRSNNKKSSSSSSKHPSASGATTSKRPMPPSSYAGTELDRRVQQVLQILPHFGEGFVEVALGLYKGDVEATVATLLNHPSDGNSSDSSYPTALRVLDPKLPRRKREFQAYQTAEEEAIRSEEARRDVKERMALEEKQKRDQYEALVVATTPQQQEMAGSAEAAATSSKNITQTSEMSTTEKKSTRKEVRQQKLKQKRVKDEYNDDYDDQYDEIDIKLGAADDGFTSDNIMTYQQVKLYNQVVQEDESDSAFWDSNRNTNQKGGKTNSKNDNIGENKWGPDKIKGGRVIGPDGKIVRKPGGTKKKKANNNNHNSNNNGSNSNNNNNNNRNDKVQGGKPKPSNNSSSTNNTSAATNNGNKKKPKTKPRSDNRINRQRDKKFKKQGVFGVQE